MFRVCEQFFPLKTTKREDMEQLSKTFIKIEDNIRKKKHDLLDTKVSAFDTDYLEFSVQVSELQDAMLAFIDETFSNITDVRRSLQLLTQFEWMKRINRLQSDLNAKISPTTLPHIAILNSNSSWQNRFPVVTSEFHHMYSL